MELALPVKKTDIADIKSDKNSGIDSSDIYQHLQAAMKEFDSLLSAEVDLKSVVKSPRVNEVEITIHNAEINMKGSRTAKLWLGYLELLDNLKKIIIKGERTGDWLLHLQSLLEMLPFFAATGHNAYAKSTYIYLNKMLDLPTTHPQVYRNFMKGMHVIGRSDRYWAGLSTDLIIEQMLMRSVKTVGGLTRGSGMDEAQRAQWILSRPACSEINYKMQELTGQKCESSEQHKESSESRKSRDNDDIQKMFACLVDRNPFMAE
ncbi:hypothetical protein MAR_005823 [Mya arenaria]|uniref:Uncharacterized protein n=1 Tax=Mya arenaria TaxID=6604 RepID=A0ABY7F0K9_MYAAR|nr:hypothetical protein MAR_005823 [Mya arenaria]